MLISHQGSILDRSWTDRWRVNTEGQRTMMEASLGPSALVLDSPRSGHWMPPAEDGSPPPAALLAAQFAR
jgi:hypothetical protein